MTRLESFCRARVSADPLCPPVPDCHSTVPALLETTRLPSVRMVTWLLLPVPEVQEHHSMPPGPYSHRFPSVCIFRVYCPFGDWMACPAVSVAGSWLVRLELRVQTGPAGESMT